MNPLDLKSVRVVTQLPPRRPYQAQETFHVYIPDLWVPFFRNRHVLVLRGPGPNASIGCAWRGCLLLLREYQCGAGSGGGEQTISGDFLGAFRC